MTAGHTGAGMAAAVLRLGRLPGVDRPALAVQMSTDGGPVVLLDIGANPDSSPENLAQYARMGAIFADRVLGVADPSVALLSIGEEKGKGDARIQRATELIDETNLRFVGNVEGKDIVKHMADVIVCDAVLGNVVIKFFEGLSGYIFDLFRAEFRGSLRGRLAYLLLKPGVGRIRGGVRLRAGRRLAAPRGTRDRDHHPRPGAPADDRLRGRGRGDDGSNARAGAHRRGLRGRGRQGDDDRTNDGSNDAATDATTQPPARDRRGDAIDPSPQPEPLESAP